MHRIRTDAKSFTTYTDVIAGEIVRRRWLTLLFRDAVVAQGKVFVPASLSTSGGFGPKFKQFFGDLVKHSADYNNIPAAALTHN
jgi:hypothetical protein